MRPAAPERGRRLLVVLFVVYLVLLAWIILWKLEVPTIGAAAPFYRPIKLIPFLPTADDGPSEPLEILANILLFIPFGVYLGLLAPRWRWWMPAAVFLGASLVLEIVQHLVSTGSFDTTDIIVNTAGGVLGLGVLALARRRLQARTIPIIGRSGLIATVVALIAIVAFIASPIRYAQQPDVIVPRPGTSHTP